VLPWRMICRSGMAGSSSTSFPKVAALYWRPPTLTLMYGPACGIRQTPHGPGEDEELEALPELVLQRVVQVDPVEVGAELADAGAVFGADGAGAPPGGELGSGAVDLPVVGYNPLPSR
jgi:hypothetical protein